MFFNEVSIIYFHYLFFIDLEDSIPSEPVVVIYTVLPAFCKVWRIFYSVS